MPGRWSGWLWPSHAGIPEQSSRGNREAGRTILSALFCIFLYGTSPGSNCGIFPEIPGTTGGFHLLSSALAHHDDRTAHIGFPYRIFLSGTGPESRTCALTGTEYYIDQAELPACNNQ